MNVRAVVASAAVAALTALQLLAGPAHAQIATEFSVGIPPAPANRGIALGPDGNIWFTEFTGNRIGKITPAGVVTEYSAGLSPGAGPGGITAGPDGNVWFVERLTSKIGRITPAGVITEFSGLAANSLPVAIVTGPDGNLWFTESTANKIGRITTAGVITEFGAGITANAGLSTIEAGPDGNLWFTEQGASKIGRITTSGVVTEFSAGITAGAGPASIALGPDNNLWFTEFNVNKIAYITTAGVVTEFGGLTAFGGANGLGLGPDGNMWFTELNGNRIGKITTAGVVTEYSGGLSPNSGPRNIVQGSDGNLWFTEFNAGQIGKSTTLGVITEFNAGITPGALPAAIANGPDGNLWFTEYGVDAIGRITTAGVVTQFTAGITPGAGPALIALGPDGNLWFTENNIPRIGRITPTGVVTEFSAGIAPAANLQMITAGPDGNMWFAECDGNRIGVIIALPANGTVGTVTEYSAGISPSSCPSGIFKGPDNNMWFTEFDGNRIGKIIALPANGTVGTITEYSAGIIGGAGPNDITAGPDGNMWFTEYNSNRIGKIIALPANGTVGTVTEFTGGIFPGSHPNFITLGPDGNLWFTEDTGNRIGRITPAGVVATFGTGISAGSGLYGITGGPDGNMWFTELLGARIGRLMMPTGTYVVTNNTDNGAAGSGSLRDAIQRANADPGPNTITFDPAVTGTITLTSGQIQITQAMSIVGPGAATLTIDGNAANRILAIALTDPACPALDGADYTVAISGLRFANGHRLQSNAAGAIFTEHSLSLDSVILENNIAGNGGAITMHLQYPGQSLTINNTQFLNNKGQPIGPSATGIFGAALAVYERCSGTHTTPVPVNISNSLFSGNQALPTTLSGLGGAIATDSVADFTITDTRIVNNSVIAPNPPIGTQIYRGGGIYGHAKSLNIVRSEISGNAATDVTGADLTRGGGLSLFNNDPTLQGAADVMAVKLVNSTVSGNSSSATAGAMLVLNNVSLELDNSTVSNNTAPQTRTGGIVFSTGAGLATPTMVVTSSILADNSSDGGDVATNLASIPTFTINATNSLIEKTCPSPSCEITVAGSGNLLGIDPMLAPLANNGGPTQTQALIVGSPAINAGSNPLSLTTDQRGGTFARVVGAAADMGAYEFVPPGGTTPVIVSAASRRTHGAAGPFNLPLTLTALGVVNHNPTTEPRQGPNQTIVFTFDKPLNAATVTITEGTATAAAPTFSGNDVVVGLTGVTDRQYVTVSLTSVGSTDGGTGGSAEARIGFLVGDVNQTRVVSVADLGLVNQQLAQIVTAANYLKDVNASGTLTLADKGITNQNLTKALPAP